LMGVITHGYKKGCFGHYCPLLVQMGSWFNSTLFAKFLRDLEDSHLDMYGDLIYDSVSSKNPLLDALLDTFINSNCRA
jgi:hypothetical protein